MIKIIIGVAIGLYIAYFGFTDPTEVTKQVLDEVTQTQTIEAVGEQGATYKVLSVTDGDTFKVGINGVTESVRLLGINTPETEFSSRGAECFGEEASERAKALLQNTSVQLTSDDSQDVRDKFNRILAYATLPDGRDFGEVMIAEGYARELTFKGIPYKNQQLYKAAQKQAEENKVGLWEERVCNE